MSLSISCICLTYGRPRHLAEAVSCFLAQDYPGPKQMVVFNTHPGQKIVGELPNVKIVNCPQRPPSLGVARNLAIAEADGDIIVTTDDDDLYLPHHLSVIAQGFERSNADWVRITPVWYSERWKVKKTFGTWANSVAFTVDAWEKAGAYADMNVGEDRNFLGKLSQHCRGVILELKPEEIPAIYCWDNAVWHISGDGEKADSYEKARQELEKRQRLGGVPETLALEPKLTHDPSKMVKEFLDHQAHVKKNSVCLIELGRYGDIINILPLAKHINESYGRPSIMVSQEFASVLEGVSYADAEVVDFGNEYLTRALPIAQKKFEHVIQCQVWGRNYTARKETDSYNRESWRIAGFLNEFHNPAWRPVFDRRDTAREGQFCNRITAWKKPVIVANLTRSASSPFPGGQKLMEAVQFFFKDTHEFVDVSQLRLPHIYDLLGVIERAACVVSIDTALLHLTMATTTPLVAIVNPQPWQGSSLRFPTGQRFTYTEATADPTAVISAIIAASQMNRADLAFTPPRCPPERKFFHAVERHPERRDYERVRKEVCWRSWDALYKDGVVPCHLWEQDYPRTAKSIGEIRNLPFLKDVLALGLKDCGDEDIMFWTNDDNYLHRSLPGILNYYCGVWGWVCSQRCEFIDTKMQENRPLNYYTEGGRMHLGRDLFAATGRWWRDHWDDIPDFIIGCSDFDLALCCLFRLEHGIKTTRQNIEHNFFPAELPRGYISHQYHPPKWADPNYVDKARGQKWNRGLFRAWAAEKLPELKFNLNGTI